MQLIPAFTQTNPDNTVGGDTFLDPNLYGFDEGQFTVSDDLASEVAGLTAGMVVESHYIAYNPRQRTTLAGYVDFDAPIVGIATSLSGMLAANTLVNTGVTYLNPRFVGPERVDRAAIDNITRVLLNFRASSPGDYMRVFTMVQPPQVPLPAAAWMFLAGLAGLAGHRKKQRGQIVK